MTTMKVANFHRGSEATGDHFSRAYKPEPVFSFFSYLKRRSRTRAVVPEKSTPPMLEKPSPIAHDEDQKSSMAFQQDQETPIFVSESEFESFVIEHETSGKQLTIEKILANGDFYSGHYKGNAPEGEGKYLWSDGCMYEGQWGAGKTTGRGKISWPSGATYEGDCMRGCLHGHGTFTAIDGATYKGNWKLNLRHGFGEKRYTNNDLYEGFWKDGMQDGSGRYVWANGNEYAGDWKSGIMAGKGTLTWACGDRYEGEWHDGLEHGKGVYTWSDGACYIGSWKKGLKDGKGIFYPAGCLPPSAKSSKETTELHHEEKDLGLSSEMDRRIHCRSRSFSSAGDFCDGAPARSQWVASLEDGYVSTSDIPGPDQSFERRWSLEGSVEKHINIYRKQLELEGYRKGLFGNMEPIETPIMEREYIEGVLINEIVKHSIPVFPRKGTRRRQRRQSKEIKRPGETVIKGHRSYDLMMNLQLGIRYSVGKVTQELKQDIGPLHFGPRAILQIRFPKSGSQLTPRHQSFDFKWKDFCPAVFRSLREMFKIDAADYMLSICGSAALRELSSPGKSGSVFYLSHDDRFIIKTMRKAEVKVLLEMLPSYYQHVKMYESTLVTKFFGLHQVEPYGGGRKVRFVVMGNMFCTDLKIHRRFDLKGSSQGRSTDKVEIDENTTFKDLDLNFVFHLEPSWRKAILRQLECDCKFLEAQRIMDYSLLLGIHFRAPEYPAIFSPVPLRSNDLLADGIQTSLPDIESFLPDVRADDLADKLLSVTGPRRHIRESSIGAKYENGVLAVPGATRLKIRLGVNMPARADRRLLIENHSAAQENHPGDVYDVVLYFGVIDILQQYDMTKKVEHAYKSLQFDAQSISAVDPKLYSQRFQDLVRRVFPASDCS